MRRIVPSPEPLRIVEETILARLVAAGVTTICGGGGGIPVIREPSDGLRGVECVVDKDLFAALLAERLGADLLLLLTDVPAVFADWPSPAREPIRRNRDRAESRLQRPPNSKPREAASTC